MLMPGESESCTGVEQLSAAPLTVRMEDGEDGVAPTFTHSVT